ncbi:hypothetical protein GZ77_03815 [Endozoicomonas montiporae]|uniref:Uncharacterized protein n=2 Tax=Endozoicomonas montiporae TaxID=1027273 RepID=A0A081NB84_9GAMM|nr:hypothetical protein [Endozoicomonas montiporae]AMO56572.1 hypothetical protein EZMO1_2488 [Endozoicomonas montiporae CL-33]KEQ15707.1 hypothetical protein GZ77_03815 [Endozoicomonas montiporae]
MEENNKYRKWLQQVADTSHSHIEPYRGDKPWRRYYEQGLTPKQAFLKEYPRYEENNDQEIFRMFEKITVNNNEPACVHYTMDDYPEIVKDYP